MSVTFQVSLVEDDAGVRRELESLINAAPGFRCIKTYADAESALAGIPQHPPDLVLMDIHLPGMSGIECVRRLRELRPVLPIVMLTVYEDSDTLFQSLMAGANGYLVKHCPRPKLVEALGDFCAGGVPLSRSMARRLLDFFRRVSQLPAAAYQPAERLKLTPREQEILARLAQGHPCAEIATALGLSDAAARQHMARVCEKLQALARTEAIQDYLGR